MPIYYLNLFNDFDSIDEQGCQCPDLATAKIKAVSAARDIMAEHVQLGRPLKLHHRMEVVDESGKVLAVIPFREIITVTDDLHDMR